MEGDRKAFSEETSTKLAKQRSVINALQKEKESLLTDLRVAMSESNRRKDVEVSGQMNNLLDDYGNFDALLKKEKAHLDEVNKQITKVVGLFLMIFA